MALYDEGGEPTTGRNPFTEWALLDLELQREAREAVLSIEQFPDLERRIISVFGPTAEAIMLHQLAGYWFRKPKMQDRWGAYKTRDEWKEERGLNRKQSDRGRKRLTASGVVDWRFGPYRRIHYQIGWVRLAELLKLFKELPDEDSFSGNHVCTSVSCSYLWCLVPEAATRRWKQANGVSVTYVAPP